MKKLIIFSGILGTILCSSYLSSFSKEKFEEGYQAGQSEALRNLSTSDIDRSLEYEIVQNYIWNNETELLEELLRKHEDTAMQILNSRFIDAYYSDIYAEGYIDAKEDYGIDD